MEPMTAGDGVNPLSLGMLVILMTSSENDPDDIFDFTGEICLLYTPVTLKVIG